MFSITIVCAVFEQVSPVHYSALAMFHEARGEGLMGQVAVFDVINNRVADKRWPNSVKAVVTGGMNRGKSCDFSFMCNGRAINPWAMGSEYWTTWLAIRGEAFVLWALNAVGLRPDVTNGSRYYKRFDVRSPWFEAQLKKGKMRHVGLIGAHEFFK